MTTISFLGLGAMGSPMAERLLGPGRSLRVFDIAATAMKPLVEKGAQGFDSPRTAAEGAEIVFACLPNPAVSRAVAFGENGISSTRGIRAYVEMSTIGSAAIEEIASGLAPLGIGVVDAPVSGGPRGARAGTLSIIAASDEALLALVRPHLERITANIHVVGERPGLGQITKLVNNMISGAGMAAAFEGAALAVKAGVDADVLIDVLNVSTGRNSATLDKFPASILPRSFDYGGKVQTMYKDVALCLEEARRRDVPMWVGSAVVNLWFQAMTQGRADDDYTTLIKVVEDWAGVKIGSRSAIEAEG